MSHCVHLAITSLHPKRIVSIIGWCSSATPAKSWKSPKPIVSTSYLSPEVLGKSFAVMHLPTCRIRLLRVWIQGLCSAFLHRGGPEYAFGREGLVTSHKLYHFIDLQSDHGSYDTTFRHNSLLSTVLRPRSTIATSFWTRHYRGNLATSAPSVVMMVQSTTSPRMTTCSSRSSAQTEIACILGSNCIF